MTTAQGPTISWRFSPLKGRRAAAAFLAVLLPAVVVLVFLQSRNPVTTALAAAFLLVAVAPALLPTAFELDAEGVTVKHLGRVVRRPWTAFRRVMVDGDVVVLSPFARASFLDTFRGLYLRFNREDEAVREAALRHVLGRLSREDRDELQ
jgi:hypothetical protein